MGLLLGTVILAASPAAAANLCDLNADASVNVLDVQTVINQALGISPAINDLTGDGVVNVADIQLETMAALGLGCLAGPHTYSVGGALVSIENTFSPLPAGTFTYQAVAAPVSVENTFPPLATGTFTYQAVAAPVAVENTFAPLATGTFTYQAVAPPVAVENSISPAPSTPQTYVVPSRFVSLFNGPNPPASAQTALAPSLRFRRPVDPAFLAAALVRGAQNVNGKAGCQDTDNDGLCDADELVLGTSPYLADTDGDGYPDGLELTLGSDPLDPSSIPDIRPGGYFATPPVSIETIRRIAILTPSRQGAIHVREVR